MKGRLEGGKKEAGKAGGKEGRGGGRKRGSKEREREEKRKREDRTLHHETVNSRRRGKYSESCGNHSIIQEMFSQILI